MSDPATQIAFRNVSRRDFLKAGLGLSLAVMLPSCSDQQQLSTQSAVDENIELIPNAFLRVGTDDTVTVIAKHLEMGQGAYTGLATLVAEELGAQWAQVEVEAAPADAKHYNNLDWGGYQGTGGSSAIKNAYMQMRKAGATARAMLVQAAAEKWKAPIEKIAVKNGVVSYRGYQITFGDLVEAAVKLPVPDQVQLKEPKDFTLIGQHLPRKDSAVKTNGQAVFTQDIHLENMLVAVVAHPPYFGAKPQIYDDHEVRAIPGVVDVVKIPNGVAVLAEHFWAAKKGRDALKVQWNASHAYHGSSEDIIQQYQQLAKKPGVVAAQSGNAIAQIRKGKRTFTYEYVFPFLAHAAMEPMNCVMQFNGEICEVWNGNQLHSVDQYALSKFFAINTDKVKINTVFAGGSFGRRGNPQSDYLLEAASIIKALDTKQPIKLVWTREDDMQAGYYRPLYVHRLAASLDENGLPIAWHHTIVGQSIVKDTVFEASLVKDGVDGTSVEGASNLPYSVPHFQVDLHTTNDQVKVPVQWWRSVGSTHTAYATEVFLDQLANSVGQEPLAYRLALLQNKPRHAKTLELAFDKAALISQDTRRVYGQGMAVHESFNTVVAQVVDVSLDDGNNLKVERVVCAVDCGIAVNPDVIKAQMEGSIGFALTAALSGEITLEKGVVQQKNFDRYPILRMSEMPKIEVYVVPSTSPPTGVGEPGVPPLAPALANAIFNATRQHITRLPIGDQLKS